MIKSNNAVRIAEEEAEYARDEAEAEAEYERFDREDEAEEDKFDSPEELFDAVLTAAPEDGGFSDLWDHEPNRQIILDAAEVAIAEGHPNDAYSTYRRVCERLRARNEGLAAGNLDGQDENRQDVLTQVSAQLERERQVGNAYCEAGAAPDPEGLQAIGQQFDSDFSDLDEAGTEEAANLVDEAHNNQYVTQGVANNSYRVYQDAGEKARLRQIIREREDNKNGEKSAF